MNLSPTLIPCATLLVAACCCGSTTTRAQELLPFLDDFCKPASQHRNPYEERMETERHDFTQSATTVGRDVFQVETGYTYFRKSTADEKESSHTGPELQLRLGITEDIELRMRYNYAWKFIEEEEDERGGEDMRFAVKLQTSRFEHPCLLPTSALEIRFSAPTAEETFSTGKTEFSLDYIAQWELNEWMTFAGSAGWGTNGFGDFGLIPPDEFGRDNYNAFSASVVLGLELSEKNALYSEWFGIFTDGLAEDTSFSYYNIGIDHYITQNLVVDVRVGAGLTESSDDFFSGVGGGVRF